MTTTGSYQFVVKDGSLTPFKTVGTSEFFSDFAYGDVITGSLYPMMAQVSSDFYLQGQTRNRIRALKNTLNHYKYLSPHYSYDYYSNSPLRVINIPSIFYGQSIKKGSVSCKWYVSGTLIAELRDVNKNGELIQVSRDSSYVFSGVAAFGNFEVVSALSHPTPSITITDAIGLTQTFAIDNGFGIASGSILVTPSGGGTTNEQYALGFATAIDTSALRINVGLLSNTVFLDQQDVGTIGNTVIIDNTGGSFPATGFINGENPIGKPINGSGSVQGVVLYNEGFILLTGSLNLHSVYTDEFNIYDPGVAIYSPGWIYWYGTGSNGVGLTPSSSFGLDFEGTEQIPTITMLTQASKGEFNHSNNPTFLEYGQVLTPFTSSNAYVERNEIELKNIVRAPYVEVGPKFEKTTFISKVGIYDENKNLIAIGKLATPVRKKESESLTIKLKLDM